MTKITMDGVVRKVALITLIQSAIGYLMFVIGWGILVSSVGSTRSQIPQFAYYWYCVAAGPLVFICCLLRVILLLPPKAHYVLMVITFILMSSYISAGGYVLYDIGAIVDALNNNSRSSYPTNIIFAIVKYMSISLHQPNVIFAGMIITQIFSMVTGAIFGFIDVKLGMEMQVA